MTQCNDSRHAHHFEWFKTKNKRFTTESKRISNIGRSLTPNFEWEIILIIVGSPEYSNIFVKWVRSLLLDSMNGILSAALNEFLMEYEHIVRGIIDGRPYGLFIGYIERMEKMNRFVQVLRVFTTPQHWKCKHQASHWTNGRRKEWEFPKKRCGAAN